MASPLRITLVVAAIMVLIVLDIGLKLHQINENAFMTEFRIVHVHTNHTSGVVIVDRKTKQPLWGRWNFGAEGRAETVSYFFDGKNVMNFYPQLDQPPRFDVSFFGHDGNVKAVWINRGTNAGFTERVLYDKESPRKEVWFNETWHPAVYYTNQGQTELGIVLNGKWQHLVLTNGSARIPP